MPGLPAGREPSARPEGGAVVAAGRILDCGVSKRRRPHFSRNPHYVNGMQSVHPRRTAGRGCHTMDTEPRMPPPYAAVIFDMDGVLVDTEPLHLRALNQVLARGGFRLS